MASYPLSSQASDHVEVDLGCDNIKYCKNLRPFCLSLDLGLMKRLFITLRGYSGLSHNSVGSLLPERSGHMR